MEEEEEGERAGLFIVKLLLNWNFWLFRGAFVCSGGVFQ